MLSSLGNFFGGVENKKVSSSNSNGSDLSYDSFMEESGFSTDVISSPADEVKMFTLKGQTQLMEKLERAYPGTTFGSKQREARRKNIARLPNQWARAEANVRSWKKGYASCIRLSDADRLVQEMEIALRGIISSENAGLRDQDPELQDLIAEGDGYDEVQFDYSNKRSICSVFYLTLLLFLFLFIVLSGAKFMAPPSSWLVLLV